MKVTLRKVPLATRREYGIKPHQDREKRFAHSAGTSATARPRWRSCSGPGEVSREVYEHRDPTRCSFKIHRIRPAIVRMMKQSVPAQN